MNASAGSRRRPWWLVLKISLALAIVIFFVRRFWQDLVQAQQMGLWERLVGYHAGWLVFSGLLYLTGLGFSLLFWYRLLQILGERPTPVAAVRAYYLGHWGKYLPGKAWALALRAALIRSPGVRLSVAVATSFYEVLVTMAGGTLLAVLLFLIYGQEQTEKFPRGIVLSLISGHDPGPVVLDRRVLILLGVILCAIVGTPVLPFVFNRIVRRVSLPLMGASRPAIPWIGWDALGQGLLLTAVGWLFLGASTWAALQPLLEHPLPLTLETLARQSGFMALAYVAGFVIVLIPNGLGIREFFLVVFLEQELTQLHEPNAGIVALAAAIVVRLVWMGAEMLAFPVLYWLPGPSLAAASELKRQGAETA